MMMEILNKNYKTISIIGMAKNVGKTVVLNELIEQSHNYNIKLAITSIGRDGEEKDLVSSTYKPRIFVYRGTIITTAEKLLNNSSIKYEILYVFNNKTVLGRILIIKVIREGYVDISGVSSNKEIKLASDMMLKFGADITIIDGAIDRKTSASPFISEAAILVTGASLDRNIEKVVSETVYKYNLLTSRQISGNLPKESIKAILDRGKIGVVDSEKNTVKYIEVKSAIGSGKKIAESINENGILVLPGVLTENLLKDLKKYNSNKKIFIVVRDGTKIFVKRDKLLWYESLGIKVRILDKVKIVFLAVNPYSIKGYYFESEIIIKKLKEYIKSIPIIDVLKEEGYGN